MRKKINTQKIKNFTFRFFCILLALTLTQLNTPRTFAAVEDFLDKFAANNIMFYNPDECNGEGNSSKDYCKNVFCIIVESGSETNENLKLTIKKELSKNGYDIANYEVEYVKEN